VTRDSSNRRTAARPEPDVGEQLSVYGFGMQPEVYGLETVRCPFSYEAVMEEAPQVQSLACLTEGWSAVAPAEAEQEAIANNAIVVASLRLCARDDVPLLTFAVL